MTTMAQHSIKNLKNFAGCIRVLLFSDASIENSGNDGDSRGYPSQNKPRPEVRLGVARQEGADEQRLTTRRLMRERIMLG
ncbi:MAG: hypothetical protein WAK33_03475, partial [Silvibacterium sp.]